MNIQHRDLLQRWIEALSADSFNLEHTQAIAQELSQALVSSTQMRNLVLALQGTVEDPFDCSVCQEKLSEFIHAAAGESYDDEVGEEWMADVKKHLALCAHCTAAFADVLEMTQLSIADAVPMSSSYPAFDLDFLASSAPADVESGVGHPLGKLIEQALESGKEWIEDAAGGIALVFGPGLQTQAAGGWAVKSSVAGTLLAQIVLGDDEVEGWEIEGSVFADSEDESLCQVEVSLYNVDDAEADLAGIPVVVSYGEAEISGETDEGGVAEFATIPKAQLPQLGVYVEFIRSDS